jgi:hypothetical protein
MEGRIIPIPREATMQPFHKSLSDRFAIVT